MRDAEFAGTKLRVKEFPEVNAYGLDTSNCSIQKVQNGFKVHVPGASGFIAEIEDD